MPCNSDHMEPHGIEIQLSQLACLLDEVAGKKWTKNEWRGYHPTVYGKPVSTARRDRMTATLCDALSRMDVTKCSLEMQMWWRDHQEADKARIEREKKGRELANGGFLLMYFDMEDMKWYFGGLHPNKGFHWCEDMRHSTLFSEAQVKTIRDSLKNSDNADERDFQVFKKQDA